MPWNPLPGDIAIAPKHDGVGFVVGVGIDFWGPYFEVWWKDGLEVHRQWELTPGPRP